MQGHPSLKWDNSCKHQNSEELKKKKKYTSILFTKQVKGNGVVIFNKTDYIEKTESILNNNSKFKVIKGDWFKHIIALEDKLNINLRKKI